MASYVLYHILQIIRGGKLLRLDVTVAYTESNSQPGCFRQEKYCDLVATDRSTKTANFSTVNNLQYMVIDIREQKAPSYIYYL